MQNKFAKGGGSVTDISKLSETERNAVLARRAYYREWRARNKDKVNETNRRFWEKKSAQLKGKEGVNNECRKD